MPNANFLEQIDEILNRRLRQANVGIPSIEDPRGSLPLSRHEKNMDRMADDLGPQSGQYVGGHYGGYHNPKLRGAWDEVTRNEPEEDFELNESFELESVEPYDTGAKPNLMDLEETVDVDVVEPFDDAESDFYDDIPDFDSMTNEEIDAYLTDLETAAIASEQSAPEIV
jgi:hypothetical protein